MTPEVLTTATTASVPIIFVVLALGWLYGQAGLSGRLQLGASFLTGFVLGGGYLVTQTQPPVTDAYSIYVYWFSVLIFGLAMGLVPSGAYEAIKHASFKGNSKAITTIEDAAVRGDE